MMKNDKTRKVKSPDTAKKRKQAEETLHHNGERYRTILENIEEGYFEIDLAGNFTFFNDAVCRFLGYPREELMGMNNRHYTDKEEFKKVFQAYNKVYKTGEPNKEFGQQVTVKDGTKRYIEGSIYLQKDSSGKPRGFRGIVRDITERKQAEDALRKKEERYRLIIENTADTIAVFDLNLNITTYISPVIRKLRGYTVQEAMTQTLNQMLTPDSFQRLSKLFAEQLALESSGTADPARTVLIELEENCKDGSTIWVEVAASFLRDNNFKPNGILTLTRNITDRKQAEERLKETLDRLRKAFGTTIQVMVSAVEMRDPYTSGHQKKSADIARAIAMEMGLPQDKVDGIRMAGIIHDIGKLSIPTEILSKPTKLTEIEFSLIKEHARSGYEMLKDVESPWPLAEIVYQHHERMNGSGYPRNLKGDEIFMESRILAVADVVEAMASHRPYRPTLGIEAALEEIEKNRGILYDATVADACLKLFREKGYQLT